MDQESDISLSWIEPESRIEIYRTFIEMIENMVGLENVPKKILLLSFELDMIQDDRKKESRKIIFQLKKLYSNLSDSDIYALAKQKSSMAMKNLDSKGLTHIDENLVLALALEDIELIIDRLSCLK